MPREAYRLTDKRIQQTKPDERGGKSVILPDGYGLRLVVMPNGRRYWQFKTKTKLETVAANGDAVSVVKESTVQIGIYPAMGLLDARQEAERLRGLVREGRSPVAERRITKIRNRAAAATTFEGVANELLAGKKKNVSPAYFKKMSGGIRANLFPVLGPLPIGQIDAPVLREALRKIEDRGSLDMLGNVRRWAGEVFDYAKSNGNYTGDNPAHALLRNVFEKHKGQRMRALDWSEVPAFVKALDTLQAEPETVLAIRLLMLSACRPGEVLGARWGEFNELQKRWTIPDERMKMKKAHAVPISNQMAEVLGDLRKLTGTREFLFPSRPGSKVKTLSGMALLKAVKRAAARNVHAHGFRSVFSTYVSESLKWPDAVKEAALAHSKQGIEGAYDRATHYAERVKLMQWYADEIDKAVKGAKIIELPRSAA